MADVIVVGAGPTGSVAATVLAQAGYEVLLLDRDTFPREKVCGDAVQSRAMAILYELGFKDQLDPDEFYPICEMRVETPNGTPLSARVSRTPENTAYIVRRFVFDHILYQLAMQSGVQFEKFNVLEPVVENDQVIGVLGTPDGSKETQKRLAPMLIAADGATSTIARKLSTYKTPDIHKAIATRGYIEAKADLNQVARINFTQALVPGYGWLFPTGARTANIGVGMRLDVYRQRQENLQDLLTGFINSPTIKNLVIEDTLHEVETWQLVFGSKKHERVFNGAILAGDAGGFIDPLLGAGIYHGMESGKHAAETALLAFETNDFSSKSLSLYNQKVDRSLGWTLKKATIVQHLIVAHPFLCNLTGRIGALHPRICEFLLKFLSGEKL